MSCAAAKIYITKSSLHTQVIAKAKVPIVKFTEIESDLQFDISFDVANGPAVRAST